MRDDAQEIVNDDWFGQWSIEYASWLQRGRADRGRLGRGLPTWIDGR